MFRESIEKTIWLFKEQFKEKQLSHILFDLFTSQLLNNGIIAREGSIVDASFVNVPRKRNSRKDNTDIKAGAVPLEFARKDSNGRRSKLCQKDTDTCWMTKNVERHYGCNNHVNVNAYTKLITKFSVSRTAPHDSIKLENIVNEEDNILYADSAYRSAKIEEYL